MNMEVIPKTGWKGLIENWQSDLIAAISVALVAMPLALGIAMASGVPPMAGILSAVIGGIVTTFFRGSYVAINGPAAGLIAVILASIAALDDGSGQALNYVFAAIVVSGAIQVVLGLLKMGRFADLFHSTVIHGILAAIGVIIFAKQIHVAMGTSTDATSIIQTLVEAVKEIPNVNPFVALISLLGLVLLVFQSKISYRFFHFLPAPMWVLVISIPFVYFFNFFDAREVEFFGKAYEVGPQLLINIPDNILDAITFPDFSKINTLPFWTSVLSITLIASVESLASAKAVDKLDPYKRKTDLNKDLMGIGASTLVSGALGGLPIINVIVRSTVNVHNHAKTKWSNLYHGILLLAFIFILGPVIQKVPLCALAIILVYTGYKLASPQIFKHVYSHGIEQLIFFAGTLIITLFTDLLIGIFFGLFLALVTHFLLAKVSVRSFFKMIFRSGSNVEQLGDMDYVLHVKGVANFLSTMHINSLIQKIPTTANVRVDMSSARLVDFSILELLHEFKRTASHHGGGVQLTGLENHSSSSNDKLALRVLTTPIKKPTKREIKLRELSDASGWKFRDEPTESFDYFESFDFFRSRPIEKKSNCMFHQADHYEWEIFDVIFDEGAFMAFEVYNTTLGLVKLDRPIPKFTIEKKDLQEKLFHLSSHKDIDYVLYEDFSRDYIVKVENTERMKSFLTDDVIRVISECETIHHLESNGESILLFMDNLKLAPVKSWPKVASFARDLADAISGRKMT